MWQRNFTMNNYLSPALLSPLTASTGSFRSFLIQRNTNEARLPSWQPGFNPFPVLVRHTWFFHLYDNLIFCWLQLCITHGGQRRRPSVSQQSALFFGSWVVEGLGESSLDVFPNVLQFIFSFFGGGYPNNRIVIVHPVERFDILPQLFFNNAGSLRVIVILDPPSNFVKNQISVGVDDLFSFVSGFF